MAKKERVKGETINLQDRVTGVATDKHPYLNKGEKFVCHPKMLEYFQKHGVAEGGSKSKKVEA